MTAGFRPSLGYGAAWRRLATALVFVLSASLVLADGGAANAGDVGSPGADASSTRSGTYAGVFTGIGRARNKIVDIDGFASWGNPGSTFDYRDDGLVGGALVGRKFAVAGLPLRIEIDGTFGDLSAFTGRLDPGPFADPPPPRGTDEAVDSKMGWIATARVGVERTVGPATVFVAGGAALARIVNSLADIDRGLDRSVDPPRPTPWRADPDDSFRDAATRVGWTIGAGVETALAEGWTLRLEGAYLDFGHRTYTANRSGNDPCCGSGTPRRPVAYRVDNKVRVIRLAIIRAFDW